MNNVTYTIMICTYNGADRIEKSLLSLINQAFPKDRYEILVIDDGSTDNTSEIISKYGVRCLRFNKNVGIPTARNRGLKNARGEIIICYDDDCIAPDNWLSNLVTAYKDPQVMGAGSVIYTTKDSSFTEVYCSRIGYGNPAPLTLGKSKNIFLRFLAYIKTNITNPQSRYKDYTQILALPGAVSSFRKSVLIEIGGWNNELKTVAEDDDLCRRLRERFPDYYFVVVPSAKLNHNHRMNYFDFLIKEFKRSKRRLLYYKIKGEVPPYFPGPIFFALILASLALMPHSIYLYAFIILFPFLLYPWWIIRLFSEKDFAILLYPYMQLSYETTILLGILTNK